MLPSLHSCPIGTGADDRSQTVAKLEGDKWDFLLLDLLEAELKGLIAESVVDDRPCTELEALWLTNKAAVLGKDEVLYAVEKSMRDNLWLDRALKGRGVTLRDLTALCIDLKEVNKFFDDIPKWVGSRGPILGPDVKDFKIGDKVAYASMPIGSYATHRVFPTKKLVKVPNEIELENVVTLMTKGFTVFYLLHKTYPVKSGETILFHAAAGGVGQIFCQWAKSLGCTVIGTVGSDEKIAIAKANGCDHVINYSKENFSEKVKEITNETISV